MDTKKKQRIQLFQAKREALLKQCETCRRQNRYFPPTAERCDACTFGKRIRYLETEYSDLTGWSHEQWKKP